MSRRASCPSPTCRAQIYLVTIFEGQYRVALLNRPRGGLLSGVLLTLAAGQGAQLIPAAVPIALVSTADRPDPEVGVIREGDPCYADYHSCVDRVTDGGYALFPR